MRVQEEEYGTARDQCVDESSDNDEDDVDDDNDGIDDDGGGDGDDDGYDYAYGDGP